MDKKSQRTRAANFTKWEENMLLRIVSSHIAVVESKNTMASMNAKKDQEWDTIAHEFNSETIEQPRDAWTLRRKYENIKRVKKMRSDEKINIKTSPRPSEPFVLDRPDCPEEIISTTFDTAKPSSFASSPHPTSSAQEIDPLMDKISFAAVESDDEQQKRFNQQLHDQKMRHLEEEHAVRLKLLEQQLIHAEERQTWLREEHFKKMKPD